jgi:hypothetical protein
MLDYHFCRSHPLVNHRYPLSRYRDGEPPVNLLTIVILSPGIVTDIPLLTIVILSPGIVTESRPLLTIVILSPGIVTESRLVNHRYPLSRYRDGEPPVNVHVSSSINVSFLSCDFRHLGGV